MKNLSLSVALASAVSLAMPARPASEAGEPQNMPQTAEEARAFCRDVLLIMGEHDGTRYITWHWEYEKYRAWHGEPDPEVSKVPLVFAFPGGDVGFINTAINVATRVSGRTGDFTNADLTPIILKVLDQTR